MGAAGRRPRRDDGILDSIVCVNDRGTESTDDDGPPTQITSPDDVFTVLAHETVTCTITNSPVPAVINVDKDADGGAGTWPVVLRGPSPASDAVSDDGTIDFTTPGTFATSGPTPAGVYVLTERAGAGAFRVGGWSCSVVGGGPPPRSTARRSASRPIPVTSSTARSRTRPSHRPMSW